MRAVDRGCTSNLAGCAASLGRQVAVLYHGSTSQAARTLGRSGSAGVVKREGG